MGTSQRFILKTYRCVVLLSTNLVETSISDITWYNRSKGKNLKFASKALKIHTSSTVEHHARSGKIRKKRQLHMTNILLSKKVGTECQGPTPAGHRRRLEEAASRWRRPLERVVQARRQPSICKVLRCSIPGCSKMVLHVGAETRPGTCKRANSPQQNSQAHTSRRVAWAWEEARALVQASGNLSYSATGPRSPGQGRPKTEPE